MLCHVILYYVILYHITSYYIILLYFIHITVIDFIEEYEERGRCNDWSNSDLFNHFALYLTGNAKSWHKLKCKRMKVHQLLGVL